MSDSLFSLVLRAVFLFRGERQGGGVIGARSSASDSFLSWSLLVVVLVVGAFVLLVRGERRGGGDVGVPGMVICWKVSAGVCCVTRRVYGG